MTRETQTAERTGTDRAEETDVDTASRAKRAAAALRGRSGSLALLGGGLLVVRAARTARQNRGRAAIQAFAGAALLAVGLRRRRSGEAPRIDPGGSAAERAESQQPETNPRDVSEEPDVETATDPDEGDVQFTADRTARDKPDLDGSDSEDPRRDAAEGEDGVEVDISEASMADEASEAAGPGAEGAYPATEGTDPEPTSPGANPAESDTDEAEDDEAGTEGGASARTDTVEAGTMETDEDVEGETRPDSDREQDRTGAAYGDEPDRTEEDVDEA